VALHLASKLNKQLSQIFARFPAASVENEYSGEAWLCAVHSHADSATKLAASVGQMEAMLTTNVREFDLLASYSLSACKFAKETCEATESLTQHSKLLAASAQNSIVAAREPKLTVLGVKNVSRQLSILAVNAAVQVAHGGKDSAGFAVIAEEMRGLARQCDATVSDALTRFGQTRLEDERTAEICINTELALREIHTKFRQAEKRMSDIAVKVREQAASVANSERVIREISEDVRCNAATANAVATTSKKIITRAELLAESIRDLHALLQVPARSCASASAAVQQSDAISRQMTIGAIVPTVAATN
jgi:methyl-accepting chemotaxis protein